MTYSEIIQNNCENHCRISWWPKFAFHYTDVTNAVSIINSGYLYSRLDATHLNIMANDNASRQVIDMTNESTISKVRFYFRPLTPTQYYNEGYKHLKLRYDGDINANTPVPVFFLFDLEALLSNPNVCFSETSQAGHGTNLSSGPEAFSKLNFDMIYSIGSEGIKESKPYRHAEIVHDGSMGIADALKVILCRNDVEKTTLLNLIKEISPKAYAKYHDLIKVYKKNIFEANGLYVSDCIYHENKISISFSDSYNKRLYMEHMMSLLNVSALEPIQTRIELIWFNTHTVIRHQEITTALDYAHPSQINITHLPTVSQARTIGIKVYFDDKLMCYITQSLEPDEVIK